jgi:phasin family protein
MNQDLFQLDLYIAQHRRFAELTLNYAAKAAALQQQTLKAYAEMTFENVRAALQIDDANALQAYVSVQPARAQALAEQVRADLKQAGELSEACAAELNVLVQEAAKANPLAVMVQGLRKAA